MHPLDMSEIRQNETAPKRLSPLPSKSKQSFFQEFRKIAPTVRHDVDMNLVGLVMDAVDYAVWLGLDFAIRKNVDPLQFRRDAAPIGKEAQAVPGLNELLQKGFAHVRSFPVGDEIENFQNIPFRTMGEEDHPWRIIFHHASP